jgi:CRISPR-associated protein Cas5t
MRLALGAPATPGERLRVEDDPQAFPRVQTVYQQLHNYPVGASGKERAEDCKGNKYNITPVRREFLSDLRVVIGVDADADTLDRVRRGLAGELPRYGVPFLGDSNFLLDKVEVRDSPEPCYWYVPVAEGGAGPQPRTTRLTVAIDRADLSRTVSKLYAPSGIASLEAPPDAWTPVGPRPE